MRHVRVCVRGGQLTVRHCGSMDERSAAEFADTNCILSLVDIIVRHPKVRCFVYRFAAFRGRSGHVWMEVRRVSRHRPR